MLESRRRGERKRGKRENEGLGLDGSGVGVGVWGPQGHAHAGGKFTSASV